MNELKTALFELQDITYRDFHSRLMPGIDKDTVIGTAHRYFGSLQRNLQRTAAAETFLQELPHQYTRKIICT